MPTTRYNPPYENFSVCHVLNTWFSTCPYTWADLSIDYAAVDAHIDFNDLEESNRWVAGHHGCLDSPLAETRLNRKVMLTCQRCGAPDIEVPMWVRQDTMDINDDYGDPLRDRAYVWCWHCDEMGDQQLEAVERFIYHE